MEKRTILIVDDQIEIVRFMATRLTENSQKFNVINANNGKLGCVIAEDQQPDLIIMDWDMPEMNGIEATRWLKNHQKTADIPVIMSTGQMTSSEDLRVALEAGAVDYIRKPVDFVELQARINTVLRIRDQNESIKQLLKTEISLKDRKLSTTSMLIVEKNGLMQDFGGELDQIESMITRSPQDASKQLKQLRKRVNNHLEIDNSWETFKLHFDEVHPDFFTKLSSTYIGLSHKDMKLASYVKLGLDNKQIARLLNIEPSSTRTALTRLKKKLGLEEESSLRDTINQIS